MKVHLRGRPKQFGLIKVTCLDSLMVEMLSCVPDAPLVIQEDTIVRYRKMEVTMVQIHTFLYGAQLLVGDAKNEYFIRPTYPDGSDGAAAIEELKMFDALRLAKKHFLAMKQSCYNPGLDHTSLRVTQF